MQLINFQNASERYGFTLGVRGQGTLLFSFKDSVEYN